MHNIRHIDRMKNPPTHQGAHGEAWELNIDQVREQVGRSPESDATVALWIVFAPWAHMLWSYYMIGAVHLRPLLGKSAKINLPGATHEVMVYAADPAKAPDLIRPAQGLLSPANFHGQWVVQERRNPVDLDRTAAAKVRVTVEEILAGVLSPDTDFRHEWIKRFSDSNVRR